MVYDIGLLVVLLSFCGIKWLLNIGYRYHKMLTIGGELNKQTALNINRPTVGSILHTCCGFHRSGSIAHALLMTCLIHYARAERHKPRCRSEKTRITSNRTSSSAAAAAGEMTR